jgi:hypothetical protein
MDSIIVYLDDAAYAHQQLTPMRGDAAAPQRGGAPTHWVLVACPPHMTQRIGKWLSHTARQNWRAKWAEKLFAQVVPGLQSTGDQVTTVLAKGPLPQMTRQLVAQHHTARVLDARRPKFGQPLKPVMDGQPGADGRWEVPAALAGMGAALVLAAE